MDDDRWSSGWRDVIGTGVLASVSTYILYTKYGVRTYSEVVENDAGTLAFDNACSRVENSGIVTVIPTLKTLLLFFLFFLFCRIHLVGEREKRLLRALVFLSGNILVRECFFPCFSRLVYVEWTS